MPSGGLDPSARAAPRRIWSAWPAAVIATAADEVCASVGEITGGSRYARLVRARWAVMLALREAGWSSARIGRALGGRHHTTVLHGLKRAEALHATDAGFRAMCGRVAAA